MKKSKAVLLILSPIVIGILFNFLIIVPWLSTILMYVGPIFFMIYWGMVGGIFSEYMKNSFKATLLANLSGIISLAIYIWKFVVVSDDKRSMILAVLCQGFSAPLSNLTARIGVLVENNPNEITMTTLLIAEIAGLLIMMTIFLIGFSMKKKQKRSLIFKVWSEELCLRRKKFF
ncbi:MAG: hypothetical protein E6344_10675 [Clostridium sp.]|nr:hypothetical protein [Clostridium sp.]MDU7084148.1 hypothetical protein [Clostridium sp.]